MNFEDEMARLEEKLQQVNPIELVKDPYTTFKKYDPKFEYNYRIQWVLIGSMGDPKTWGGTETIN